MDDKLIARVLRELKKTRNAAAVGRKLGLPRGMAWRIAKKHKVALAPQGSNTKARWKDPEFRRRQAEGSRAWLAENLRNHPDFYERMRQPSSARMSRLNRDVKFRYAASVRIRKRLKDPEFERKLRGAAREGMKRYWRERRAATKGTAA